MLNITIQYKRKQIKCNQTNVLKQEKIKLNKTHKQKISNKPNLEKY